MPRLPAPEDFGVSAPRPSRGVTDISPVQVQADLATGAAMGKFADLIKQESDRLDETVALDAMNQLREKRTELTYGDDGFTKLQGGAVVKRKVTDEYPEKLKAQIEALGAGISSPAARMRFQQAANAQLADLRKDVYVHVAAQTDVYNTNTFNKAIEQFVQKASYGNTWEALTDAAPLIEREIQRHGYVDPVEITGFKQEIYGRIHAGAIDGMLQGGKATEAAAYLTANREAMTKAQLDRYGPKLKTASDAQAGEFAAKEIWGTIGPKSANDPVKIFDMESAAREKFSENPDALRSAISGLRERAQANNAQQVEVTAQNVSDFWRQVDAKVPLSKIMVSDSWQAMTHTERRKLEKDLEQEKTQEINRSTAALNRELVVMQRNERLSFMRNGDKYLTASDPDVLSKMSRAQVEALRGDFGMEPTQHLLNRWDGLQKPGKIIEARIDKQDFDQVADDLGLDPFKKDASVEHKRGLATLQYRVEQMIDLWQTERKAPMGRQDKQRLIREEMAKTVLVDPGRFAFNKEVPIIRLTSDEAKNVVVPNSDRLGIVMALGRMAAKYPRDPRYQITDENLRRVYIEMRSPYAGRVVENAK